MDNVLADNYQYLFHFSNHFFPTMYIALIAEKHIFITVYLSNMLTAHHIEINCNLCLCTSHEECYFVFLANHSLEVSMRFHFSYYAALKGA